MNGIVRTTLAALALAAMPAAAAGAQQKECKIEVSKPGALGKVTYVLSTLQMQKPADRTKNLQNAIRSLTDRPEKIDKDNSVGRQFVLGQTLMTWAGQEGIDTVAKRGDVGFKTSPEATINLLRAADSAFTAVETAMPECAGEVDQWRRQKPWPDLMTAAFKAIEAQDFARAKALVAASMVINRGPYAYSALASIARGENRLDSAVVFGEKALALSGTDTQYVEVKRQALFDLGMIHADMADAEKDSAKKAPHARAAATSLRALLDNPPPGFDSRVALSTLSRMYVLAGDTQGTKALYAAQLTSPEKYSDLDLLQAGVVASQADQAVDAAALFSGALAKNPNQRDALYNLAAAYYGSNEFAKMLPIVQRLVAVDPSNPDNWQLFAYAYQGMMKAAKSGSKEKREATDSLVKYFEMADKMPVKVSFTLFSRADDKAVLKGSIENRGAAAKTYPMKVEFLDIQGNVVATQEATVGPVAPKSKGDFAFDVAKPGIVAFRYADVR